MKQEDFSTLKALDGKTEFKMCSFQAPKIALKYSLATGNWGKANAAGTRVGVSQFLQSWSSCIWICVQPPKHMFEYVYDLSNLAKLCGCYVEGDHRILAVEMVKTSSRRLLGVTDLRLRYVNPTPSVTTNEIDKAVHQMIIDAGAYPSPLGYVGFPKSVCTSVNECMCHGIPDSRQLQDGDIINIDVTLYLNGYHGDTSKTYLCGNVDDATKRLVKFLHL